MAPAITFDTLAYANKLKAAGFDAKGAEAQAEAQANLVSTLIDDHLATKQDIQRLEQDIQNLEVRLDAKIETLGDKLLIKLGSISVMGIGILATLITVFHLH